MKEQSTEAFARQGVQRLLQQLLEEEVEHALGRRRYERREGVDAAPGYRNGFDKPRRLSMSSGTITVRRPRVRGLEGGSRVGGCRCSSGGRRMSDECLWRRLLGRVVRRLVQLPPTYFSNSTGTGTSPQTCTIPLTPAI